MYDVRTSSRKSVMAFGVGLWRHGLAEPPGFHPGQSPDPRQTSTDDLREVAKRLRQPAGRVGDQHQAMQLRPGRFRPPNPSRQAALRAARERSCERRGSPAAAPSCARRCAARRGRSPATPRAAARASTRRRHRARRPTRARPVVRRHRHCAEGGRAPARTRLTRAGPDRGKHGRDTCHGRRTRLILAALGISLRALNPRVRAHKLHQPLSSNDDLPLPSELAQPRGDVEVVHPTPYSTARHVLSRTLWTSRPR